MKVAVIGAGLVGASVAYHLARTGANVTLIDQAEPGNGTTATSFAWLNANSKTPRSYFALNVEGMREHRRLRDELGQAPWLNAGGNLEWTSDDASLAHLTERVERLSSWGYAAQWRSAKEVNAQLEPHVVFGAPDTAVAYFPDEMWIDAPRLTRTLVDEAVAAGATTRFETTVESAEQHGDSVGALRLSTGETLPTDVVVNAAGTGADRVAALFDLALPMASTSGLLLRISAEGAPLQRILHAPDVNLRPDGEGAVLAHHDAIDERRWAGESTDTLSAELLQRAHATLPQLEDAAATRAMVGVRPVPGDGYTSLGARAKLAGYYEAVTHSGVTLGPLLGRLLADEIHTGNVDPLTAAFRADRFSQASSA